MEDYASALVLAMVRRALAEQGIAVPAQPVAERVVGIEEKRVLLGRVLDDYGAAAILRVADVVGAFADHPVAGLFAGCRDAGDVLESWLAIERYFHSRHRTRIVAREPDRVVMEHFDTRGSIISAGENLAVAGLALGILRWRGAQDTTLRFAGSSAEKAFAPAAVAAEQTGSWTISWRGFNPAASPPSAQDGTHVPAVDFAGRAISDPNAVRLFAEQLRAPHKRRSAAATARAVGLSLRTLQRRLAEAGWTLGAIVASSRVHAATRLLAGTDTPLALVGLLAGYSDQPHLQREFRTAVGPTPGDYRRLASQPARLGSSA